LGSIDAQAAAQYLPGWNLFSHVVCQKVPSRNASEQVLLEEEEEEVLVSSPSHGRIRQCVYFKAILNFK
jgi:hypothetical protein